MLTMTDSVAASNSVWSRVKSWSVIRVTPPAGGDATPAGLFASEAARRQPRHDTWYVSLMGHPFPGQYKKDTYIFYSTDPVTTAIQHNQRALGNKETRLVAPHWRLLAVLRVGPSEEEAAARAAEWAHGTRGAPSKKRRGQQLAQKYGLAYFSEDVPAPGGSTEAYLRSVAPPHVAERFVYLAMAGSARAPEGGEMETDGDGPVHVKPEWMIN